MRNFISTPNNRLKIKLSTRFTIYMIDEFRTSLINCKTGKENENLYLPDKQGTLRKIHSILTYKMENGRQGCINRDKSAVNSMQYITNYFLKTKGERPEIYKRQKKENNELKETKNASDPKTSTKSTNKNKKIKEEKNIEKQVVNKKEQNKVNKKTELL